MNELVKLHIRWWLINKRLRLIVMNGNTCEFSHTMVSAPITVNNLPTIGLMTYFTAANTIIIIIVNSIGFTQYSIYTLYIKPFQNRVLRIYWLKNMFTINVFLSYKIYLQISIVCTCVFVRTPTHTQTQYVRYEVYNIATTNSLIAINWHIANNFYIIVKLL